MTDETHSKYHTSGQSGHQNLQRLRNLLCDSVSLPAAYYQIHQHHFDGRAAASTVEALMYELRTYGFAQLKNSSCQRRLPALSPEQLREVIARLIKLRPQYPKIDDALLLQLDDRLP